MKNTEKMTMKECEKLLCLFFSEDNSISFAYNSNIVTYTLNAIDGIFFVSRKSEHSILYWSVFTQYGVINKRGKCTYWYALNQEYECFLESLNEDRLLESLSQDTGCWIV